MKTRASFFVGTAGWAIPKELKLNFPERGITDSHLGRYSKVLTGVEINTSFYRNHRAHFYRKWASETPEHFRFSVKLSKAITHGERLVKCGELLEQVVPPILELNNKLGCFLVQLPPKLEFSNRTVTNFLRDFRSFYSGPLVFEPRHPSWNASCALLSRFDAALVFPDPNPALNDDLVTFGNNEIFYCRLHGSPEMYRSSYSPNSLEYFFDLLEHSKSREKWCVFDNTTFGYATQNALDFQRLASARGVNFPRETGHESAQISFH